MLRTIYRAGLRRLPYVQALQARIAAQGRFDAGHFYSPTPAPQDVEERLAMRRGVEQVRDVDYAVETQLQELASLAEVGGDCPYGGTEAAAAARWRPDQEMFSLSDAVILWCMVRRHRPRRIVEVGSGWSTAAMLDALDAPGLEETALTCVEPYPDRLLSTLRPADEARLTLHAERVQTAPRAAFEALEAGDLLFIDSSHVCKCGSDLQALLFDVLPALAPGVLIHFHDVFADFEYPPHWMRDRGIFWNECYLLRALLAGSTTYRMAVFNNHVLPLAAARGVPMPPVDAARPGGSLYLRKVA